MAGLIERYFDRMPFEAGDPIVSIEEGSTPLVPAPALSERVDADCFLKIEGANPTGSFKDRGMTAAVSAAAREGAKAIICASTGNTAASAAAYAARAGMTCAVLVPEGKIAAGKLAQALIYGARVISLNGNFDVALQLVRELADNHPISLVNSVNDFRLEGQKTASFEIVDEIGPIDLMTIPVGNAGNITAYWKGFKEYRDDLGHKAPELNGYQAAGAAPLVEGKVVEFPETVASAIRIGNPARWEEAMTAVTESRGQIRAVTDDEILDAYKWLPANEGVFCEPASAASVAGLLKYGISDEARAAAEGGRPKVVSILTGNGLKDPDTAFDNVGSVIPCEPEMGQLEKAVLG
jgi:threonine synthase